MKKLFTLVALLTCFLGAKAVEVTDLEIDYSTVTSDAWNGGWRSDDAATRVSVVPGEGIFFHSEEATANLWDAQFQLPGVPSGKLDNDALYTITIKIKGTGSVSAIHGYFSGSDRPGDIPVTSDWQTLTFEDCQNNPDAQYFANSGAILIQCGDFVGDWWISYIKITHEEKESKPVEWIENITTNGDASADWPAWSLETTDEGINTNWRGDRTGEICAWALTMGRNNDNLDGQDGRARPFPADIEEVDGNRVFVVNATQCAIIEQSPEDENSYQWANQFWIQSPKGWKSGTEVKLHFRYKASKDVTAATQIHKQHPSDYLFWQAIGDIAFTTEWQEYDGTYTFSDNSDGGWSIAFNLNAKTPVDGYEPIKFYFDDLSWQNMKLDEGWFVAGCNAASGLSYDYENAIEFTQDPDDPEVVVATIGTAGKKDSWVNEIMISTVRGNDKAFKGATIKPVGTIKGNDPDNWQEYAAGSQCKITLPAAGVWSISIAPNLESTKTEGQILFMQVEGDPIELPDPVDIVTNTTEMVVNATERDDLSDTFDQNTGERTGREEEGGAGETWDNQFWIAANRDLKKDEVTVLKFQYKAKNAARTSTQAHKVGDDGKPCTYLNWQAIGDVNFTEEWQDFEQQFTVPAGDDGMRSIVFNLSEIKEANDYYIKNVQWYLYDSSLEEGKTYKNLINADDTSNFWVKVDKSAPYQYGTDPSGITNVTAKKNSSAVIYNIAGQKVDKNFKGLVVKDGKKFMNK